MTFNRKVALGALLLLVMLLVGLSVAVPNSAADKQGSDVFSYLPFLPYQEPPVPPKGIYGLVTENSVPAAGLSVDLRFFNGTDWSTVATVVTVANGEYNFLNMPTLGTDQIYYVRYLNGTVPSRLYNWHALFINSYTAGSEVNGGNFDVANIVLVNPAPGETVTLPASFTWNPRPANPLESYEYNLFDPADNSPYFYTNPPLGYVNNYTLSGLPGGFSFDTEYGWDMWVYAADGNPTIGNWGISYYYYTVIFAESRVEAATIPAAVQHSGNAPDQLNR